MTQKRFLVENYYQDLPELGQRAMDFLEMFMQQIGAESMKEYAWLQWAISNMSRQHLCLSYNQHVLSILVALYFEKDGESYLKAMDPNFQQIHTDFCAEHQLTPCYFPIDAETGMPIYDEGCPLMDARTYEQIDLNNLGEDNNGIMSVWEIHNSGVVTMLQYLNDQGCTLMSHCDMLDTFPQILYHDPEGNLCGLFVRTVPVGLKDEPYTIPVKAVNERPDIRWYFADVHLSSFWNDLDFDDKEIIRRSPLCHNELKVVPLDEALKTMKFLKADPTW